MSLALDRMRKKDIGFAWLKFAEGNFLNSQNHLARADIFLNKSSGCQILAIGKTLMAEGWT